MVSTSIAISLKLMIVSHSPTDQYALTRERKTCAISSVDMGNRAVRAQVYNVFKAPERMHLGHWQTLRNATIESKNVLSEQSMHLILAFTIHHHRLLLRNY